MKNYLIIIALALTCSAGPALAQNSRLSNAAYCKCIEDYAYNKHIEEYYSSDFKCFRAWKKDMKRKKKLCQAKALEKDFPMAARRKRREAERKEWKVSEMTEKQGSGKRNDYWY